MIPSTIDLNEILAPERIDEAWRRVRRNRGAAGSDLVSIEEIGQSFSTAWAAVRDTILAGNYHPHPLRSVPILKPSGGVRELAIPSVMDRVVQQSLAAAISLRWEPRFSPSSFAYRPGRGPADAIRMVSRAASEFPTPWAASLDIRDCFDSVPFGLTQAVLDATPCGPAVARLAMDAVQCSRTGDLGIVQPRAGLPQGSPLSPVLANAVLDPLDHHMTSHKNPWLRYADNLLILAPDQTSAELSAMGACRILANLGLELNDAKTGITPIHEADFLGFRFERLATGAIHPRISPSALDSCRKQLHLLKLSGADAVDLDRFLLQWLSYYRLGLPDPDFEIFLREVRREFGIASTDSRPVRSGRCGMGYAGKPRCPDIELPDSESTPVGLVLSFVGFVLRRVRFGVDLGPGGPIPGIRRVRVRLGRHHLNFRL